MEAGEKHIWVAKGVEWYPEDNTILLIRCPKCGLENWAPNVISGTCAWCGHNGEEDVEAYKKSTNDR